jgi:ribonuclease VapC
VVIDTSAICAILFDEPEKPVFAASIEAAPRRLISAATHVEAALVMESRDPREGRVRLERLLAVTDAVVVAVTPLQAQLAIEAFRRYGRGRHVAGLNFGDCFAYALARDLGEPLLFKGNDFIHTDISRAVP